MRNGNRDQQRSKVYVFGGKIGETMPADYSLDDVRELVTRVATAYGIRPPKVTDGRRRTRACYDPYRHEIKLPRWARNRKTILHECAHAIAVGDEHGPVFMRVFIDLLVQYAACKRRETTKLAHALRIKIAPPAKAPQGVKPRALGRIEKIDARLVELRQEREALLNEKAKLLAPHPAKSPAVQSMFAELYQD